MAKDKDDLEWQKAIKNLKTELDINAGDLYQDSAYHPCLCVEINYEEDEIWGVSLIDGTWPRSCSLLHSGVTKLAVDEAWAMKQEFDSGCGIGKDEGIG